MSLPLKVGLSAAFAAVLLLLIGIAAFVSINVDRVHDNVETMYHENVSPLQSLGRINALLLRNRILVMDMMAHAEPAKIEKRDAELRANLDKVTKAWDVLSVGDHPATEKALIHESARARAAYVSEGLLPARDAVRAGKLDEASRIYREKISPLAAVTQAALDKLVQHQVDEAAADLAEAAKTENSVYAGTAILTTIALLLGAFLAWASTRSITRLERVERGSVLVDHAGATMARVVDSIKHVSDIVGEISSASTEQSSGVAQVGEAVSQMDQATQRNAALVEESAAAAESLKGQAQALVQAVEVFKLSAAQALPAVLRTPATHIRA